MGNQPSSSEEPANPEELARRAERRRRISEEVYQTEQSYVGSMILVTEIYIIPLTEACKTNKPILSASEIKQIFSLWQSIVEFHVKVLLPEFEARIKGWNEQTTIGDVFVKNGDFLRTYVLFVNNYDQSMELLVQLPKKNKAFENFLMEVRKNPRHNQLDLGAYLIMPIQRIPRYVMLLNDLLKYTEITHPDHKFLEQGLAKVQGIARDINEMKREDENMKKVLLIQKSIEGTFEEPLVQPHRRLIRQGPLTLTYAEIKRGAIPQIVDASAPSPSSPTFSLSSLFRFNSTKEEDEVIDPNRPVHQGWLIKQGGMIKTWKKRYFILHYHRLAYFEDEQMTKLKGVFEIDWKSSVMDEKERKKNDVPHDCIGFDSGHGRIYVFKHEHNHKEETKAWEKALTKVVTSARKLAKNAQDPHQQLGLTNGKAYHVFLFNDIVVQTTAKMSGGGYTLKGTNRLSKDYSVSRLADHHFQFESEMFILRFKATTEEVTDWIKDIQAVIDEFIKEDKVRQNIAKQSSPSMWQSLTSFFST